MQRLLVFSDSHGDIRYCREVIDNFEYKVNGIIHAGDYSRDAEKLESEYPDIPIYYVCGNTDFMSDAPAEKVFIIDGVKIFLTHGHTYYVKSESSIEYPSLARKANELHADLCVFGHTHRQDTVYFGTATLLNPGSIRYGGTYAVVEIENGKLRTTQMVI